MIFVIRNEALRFSVLFQIGVPFDKPAIIRFCEEHGFDTGIIDGCPDEPDPNSLGNNWRPDGWASSVVWMLDKPVDRETEGTLIHEIFHAVTWALHNRGIRDEESTAYLIDYLYSTAMKNIDAYYEEER